MQNLKDQEALLLCAIQHSGKATVSDVAKKLGLSPNVGRYTLNRLKDREIINGIEPFVDLCKLGFTYYSVLFSLERLRNSIREKVVEYISTHPGVVWFGEYAGEFRYGMTFIARSPREVSSFLEMFSIKFGPIVSDKEVVVKLAMTFFPRKHLSSGTKPLGKSFQYSSELSSAKLDATDHLLLKEMLLSRKISSRWLSLQIDIPESTVRLRLESLESQNVIAGYYYSFAPQALGVLTYTLLIHCKGVQPDITKSLNQYCDKNNLIVFLVEALGAWDYEVGVECFDPAELTGVMDEIKNELGARETVIKSLQQIATHRATTYPFIDSPD